MVDALDLSNFVERGEPGRAHITLAIEGVGCAGCIRKIEDGLQKLPGIVDARLNFTQRRLAVQWRDGETSAERIVTALEQIGYRAHPFAPERIAAEDNRETKWLLKCLAVAGFAAMNVMLLSVSLWAGNASDMTQETRDLFHSFCSERVALYDAKQRIKAQKAITKAMTIPVWPPTTPPMATRIPVSTASSKPVLA